MIVGFKSDGFKHLANIKQSAGDDFLGYRAGLHALKGSAIELGAIPLVDLCLAGEELKPYDIDTDRIHELANQVEDTFIKTIASLESSLLTEKLLSK